MGTLDFLDLKRTGPWKSLPSLAVDFSAVPGAEWALSMCVVPDGEGDGGDRERMSGLG